MLSLGTALCLTACAASAQPPQPSLSPAKSDAAVADVLGDLDAAASAPAPNVFGDDDVPSMADPSLRFRGDSRFEQAGLAFGQTVPGSAVTLDDVKVPVDRRGRFVLGFGQFAEPTAELSVTFPDGTSDARTIDIATRTFEFGGEIPVPANQVNRFSEEDLAHIARSTKAKNAARAKPSIAEALWLEGFGWPAQGYVSSRFGKFRRYTNGDIVRPHSGVDVAAPRAPGGGPAFNFTGAEVVAPSAGMVILAEPDMFFEGGLVLIDHGQNLETAIMHLSQIDVEAGQLVERGDRIGAAGSTGRSTGPHVHWSLKWHGRLVDPEPLVPPMGQGSGD